MTIRLKDTVSWTSQAGGNTRTKEGVVEEVVPAGKLPSRVLFPQLYRNSGVGMPRKHESYVVKVTGRGVFWPRANTLTKTKSGERHIEDGKVAIYTLAKSARGDVAIVASQVDWVDKSSSSDGDFSREVAIAERKLGDLAYTVYGSFLSTDQAASQVDLDSCQRIEG